MKAMIIVRRLGKAALLAVALAALVGASWCPARTTKDFGEVNNQTFCSAIAAQHKCTRATCTPVEFGCHCIGYSCVAEE